MATSALNPNAPIFVPTAYRAVEDFSDQWWDLIRSSPCFHDYWLRECCADGGDSFFPDLDAFDFDAFDSDLPFRGSKHEEKKSRDLVRIGSLRWQKPREAAAIRMLGRKAPKIVNVKVSPRLIQQPR
ncbi:unnamed protein product [Cuscuta campestris]|uniref:Ataxin-2 C-terminal domain-containing protein n=2 Tax=Cuscuta sect. Cleistogrammica TaxID=1824901 RepID=A0A484NI54_9ASTE|nr:hypothetical protein DM860_016166 [Cuscuta australis]VFQ99504.1 unnamed protein product [Cuscuta campestris]